MTFRCPTKGILDDSIATEGTLYGPAQKAGFWAEPLFLYLVFFQLILVFRGTNVKNLPGDGLAPGAIQYIVSSPPPLMVHELDKLGFHRFWLIQILISK